MRPRARHAPRAGRSGPAGRPHVFSLPAKAIPLPAGEKADADGAIDVALLMTPRPNDVFVIRSPRGALEAGTRLVLRCAGLDPLRGALARTITISEMGLHFDLVSAQLVHPGAPDPDRGGTSASRAGARVRDVAVMASAAVRASMEGHTPGDGFHQHASGSAVPLDGIATIANDLSMTILTPPRMSDPLTLLAPRGAVTCGAYFSLRYFDATGAKRVLVRAETIEPRPGMLDAVEATLMRPAARAEERQSYRAAFDYMFSACLHTAAGERRFRGRFIDLSASGIGFRIPSTLTPGERFTIDDPLHPDLDGAQLCVVRRDARDGHRYGATFLEPDRGAPTLASILKLDEAQREHRRRTQINQIKRARSATAMPLTDADIRTLRTRRMATRSRRATSEPHNTPTAE